MIDVRVMCIEAIKIRMCGHPCHGYLAYTGALKATPERYHRGQTTQT